MEQIKRLRGIWSLVAIAASIFSCEEPLPVTSTPDIEPIRIELESVGNSLTVESEGEFSYKLVLKGSDPFVMSQSLPRNIDMDHLVLEFEYKCDASIDNVKIFFAKDKIPSESMAKQYGGLRRSESYKKFSANVYEFFKSGWGKTSDCLRIDPGDEGNSTLYIRDILLRDMTYEERLEFEEENKVDLAKEDMANRLQTYLSTDYSSTVSNVTVTSDKVIIKGSCGGSGTYVLADITPWMDITELTQFDNNVEIKEKNFEITVDRNIAISGIEYDRVFSKWAVIKVNGDKQILDSHGRYADYVVPISSPQAIPLRNKKGLGAGTSSRYFEDCEEMNIGSITMNILINGFINSKGYDYDYGGSGYRVSTSYREEIDGLVRNAQDRDLVVSAIILAAVNSSYRDPETDKSAHYYTMPNITTPESFNQYAAVLTFLASRYNSEANGRISHWIMHNEVDMGTEWTNMGSQPMLRYLDRYIKSMRICYNVVRQYDQNASILASYTHNWSEGDNGYAPKVMLEKTVDYSDCEGDFKWGVAYHPYPQALTLPEFWKNDTQATFSLDSRYITLKNLEVIDKWINLPENLYKGETKRVLFLSEQGTNSPSYSEKDLRLQAAGAAYAWKKLSKLDGIDAMQWHNWADNRLEGGLRIGLRSFADVDFREFDPKPVWYVWKAANSSSEGEVLDPYMATLGISSWSEIMHTMQ